MSQEKTDAGSTRDRRRFALWRLRREGTGNELMFEKHDGLGFNGKPFIERFATYF